MVEILRSLGIAFYIATFSVSAYIDEEGSPPYGYTANMMPTEEGICACGPSFEFGTMFWSEETGLIICQDRGGLITDDHVDLWKETEDEMKGWGRQELSLIVISGKRTGTTWQ